MYHSDYPSEPIGGGNPYHRCSACGRSTPAINGTLEGHRDYCLYRRVKEAVLSGDLDRMRALREEVDEDVPHMYEIRAILLKGLDALEAP